MGLTVEEAFRKFGPELLRHASVLVGPAHAEDVVSEAVVSALRRKSWSDVGNPAAYLHRSVLNSARMWHRSASRRTRREWTVFLRADSTAELLPRPDVISSIRELSPRQRSVIFFTYWQDKTPRQTAEILGLSEGSVKRHLARARANLREVLDE